MNIPLIGGALFIDASTMSRFMACPQSFRNYAVERREANDPGLGRLFGQAMHLCLDQFYRNRTQPIALFFEQCSGILHKFYEENPSLAACEYRTIDYALDLLRMYAGEYETEPFAVAEDKNGPFVERPFSVPIGTVQLGALSIPIVWTGKIDLVTKWVDGEYAVLDHKTSKVGGATFFQAFTNDQAQLGYCYAAQELLGERIDGFIINALFVREPTRTGKKHELQRQRFIIEPERLLEWRENTLNVASHILMCGHKDVYPMHTTACVGRYGACEYLECCRLARTERPTMLASNLYKDVTWSPLVQ